MAQSGRNPLQSYPSPGLQHTSHAENPRSVETVVWSCEAEDQVVQVPLGVIDMLKHALPMA